MKRSKRILYFGLCLALFLILGGCASKKMSETFPMPIPQSEEKTQ